MIKVIITLIDGSRFIQMFGSNAFEYKLEIFEGLFIDLFEGDKRVRINPKFIVKVEEEELSMEGDLSA